MLFRSTPDSVNNSNFGIAIMVLNRDSTGTGAIASIDHITMTVYYRVQTGIFSQTRNKNSIIAHYNANTSSLEIFKGPGKMSNVHVINSCGEIIYADRQDMDLREKRSIRLPIINKGIYLLDAEVNGSRFSTQFIVE